MSGRPSNVVPFDPRRNLPHIRAYGDSVFAHHAELLWRSAIDPQIAHARGYRTVQHKVHLERLEPVPFAPSQRRVSPEQPGLLIPVYDAAGELACHQLRPDDPREDPKRPERHIKYETPAGVRVALDVPRFRLTKEGELEPANRWLVDASLPLLVTEGSRKADAAVSAGLCCVGLVGVWAFRGLPDWNQINLKGRDVYLCFDSDVTRKREVHLALAEAKKTLEQRRATVRVIYLPERLTTEGAA